MVLLLSLPSVLKGDRRGLIDATPKNLPQPLLTEGGEREAALAIGVLFRKTVERRDGLSVKRTLFVQIQHGLPRRSGNVETPQHHQEPRPLHAYMNHLIVQPQRLEEVRLGHVQTPIGRGVRSQFTASFEAPPGSKPEDTIHPTPNQPLTCQPNNDGTNAGGGRYRRRNRPGHNP